MKWLLNNVTSTRLASGLITVASLVALWLAAGAPFDAGY